MQLFKLISVLLSALLLTACVNSNTTTNDENAVITIKGSVTYRERMLPPPDSKLSVVLQDVSLADSSSIDITEQVFDLSNRSVPVDFELTAPAAEMKPKNTYTVRASIRDKDGRLLWTSVTSNQISATQSEQTLPLIMLQRIASR